MFGRYVQRFNPVIQRVFRGFWNGSKEPPKRWVPNFDSVFRELWNAPGRAHQWRQMMDAEAQSFWRSQCEILDRLDWEVLIFLKFFPIPYFCVFYRLILFTLSHKTNLYTLMTSIILFTCSNMTTQRFEGPHLCLGWWHSSCQEKSRWIHSPLETDHSNHAKSCGCHFSSLRPSCFYIYASDLLLLARTQHVKYLFLPGAAQAQAARGGPAPACRLGPACAARHLSKKAWPISLRQFENPNKHAKKSGRAPAGPRHSALEHEFVWTSPSSHCFSAISLNLWNLRIQTSWRLLSPAQKKHTHAFFFQRAGFETKHPVAPGDADIQQQAPCYTGRPRYAAASTVMRFFGQVWNN